jgi:hypothetical protein
MQVSDPAAYQVQLRHSQWKGTASHIRWTTPVAAAFDGNPASAWLAGNVPTQQ